MTNNNIKNEILGYVCKLCDYSTSSKDEYDKHLATPKHITTLKTTDTNYITKPETIKTWKCECGKEYKHQSSLWNHKQICKYKDEQAAIKKKEEELDMREMYETAIDENKELQDIIIEQQKTISNQNKQIALYISIVDMEYTPTIKKNIFNSVISFFMIGGSIIIFKAVSLFEPNLADK